MPSGGLFLVTHSGNRPHQLGMRLGHGAHQFLNRCFRDRHQHADRLITGRQLGEPLNFGRVIQLPADSN